MSLSLEGVGISDQCTSTIFGSPRHLEARCMALSKVASIFIALKERELRIPNKITLQFVGGPLFVVR